MSTQVSFYVTSSRLNKFETFFLGFRSSLLTSEKSIFRLLTAIQNIYSSFFLTGSKHAFYVTQVQIFFGSPNFNNIVGNAHHTMMVQCPAEAVVVTNKPDSGEQIFHDSFIPMWRRAHVGPCAYEFCTCLIQTYYHRILKQHS